MSTIEPTKPRSNGGSLFEPSSLDPVDLDLLDELQANGRLSIAELGRRVGLSAPATSERVQRLERDGVITGYRAVVDPRRLGYPLTAIIRLRPAPRELKKASKLAADTPEVVECQRVTGEDCLYMKAHLRDVDHLEQVIDLFMAYGVTTTSIVQSAPVAMRPVARPG